MKKEKLNVALVGYGQRGPLQLGLFLLMEDINVIGVCDVYEDRMLAAQKKVEETCGKKPFATTDYHELLTLKDLDAIFCFSGWISHVDICIDAMNAGVAVATEVGGACSIEQLWELVRTQERTGVPCMMLENACYDKRELTVLNMVKKGLFGELIHAEGAYRHDLRDEVGFGDRIRHYRLDQYTARNGELYPTHELGPIAKFLNINRGNRMLTLVAMASKSRGIVEWAKKQRSEDDVITNRVFNLGDVVTTLIKCANGETIMLNHDTSLPRPYSNAYVLQGTKGIWSADSYGIYLDGISPEPHKWENFDEAYKRYMHPLWAEYEKEGIKPGHGGCDWLTLRAFIDNLEDGKKMPIDVYDTASWMAITCLSEESVAMGGMPVAIPDFTNGKWTHREPFDKNKYSLEEVDESLYNLD